MGDKQTINLTIQKLAYLLVVPKIDEGLFLPEFGLVVATTSSSSLDDGEPRFGETDMARH